MTILESVTAVLSSAGLLGADLLVGVSGGLDSVCLLHLLLELQKEHGGRLEVAHIDHALRSDSALDAEFCSRLAKRYGLPFHLRRLEEGCLHGAGGVQARARERRREFFQEVLEQRSLQAIALGHHADDQAETILYRLLRGAGLRGVAGMEAVNLPYLRPLLAVRRADLADLAQRRGLEFREDPSNRSLHYARNRLRRTIIPLLSEVHPGAVDGVLRFARLAQQEDQVLSRLAHNFCSRYAVIEAEGLHFDVGRLRATETAVRWRVYLAAWERIGCDPTGLELRHLELLDELIQPGKAHRFAPLPGRGKFALSYGRLWVFHLPTPLGPSDRVKLGCGQTVSVGSDGLRMQWKDSLPQHSPALEIPRAWRNELLEMRPWMPGDRLQLRTGRQEKVKNLLMEQKIPLWRRRQVFLVSAPHGALGAVGPKFAVGGGNEGGGGWLWCELVQKSASGNF